MRVLVAIPVFAILAMLQSTIFSRLSILHGSADLIMVVVIAWSLQERIAQPWWWAAIGLIFASLMTAMPFVAVAIPYLVIVFTALMIKRRVWQSPLLIMMGTTIVATLIQHLTFYIAMALKGVLSSVSIVETQITLPSALLNLLIALPVYLFVRELVRALYSDEEMT